MNNTKFQLALQLLQEAQKEEPTISELWERFRRERQLAAQTWRSYTYVWHSQFEKRFGHLRAGELTRDMIIEWRAERREQATRTRSRKTTAGCRNSEVRILRSILGWATTCGLIGRNPIAGLELETETGTRETVITPEQVAAVERHASRQDWALFCVCVFGGLRKNEARTLRWENVDLAAGTLRITARNAKGGKKGRVTVINAVACAALDAINDGESDWVFPSRRDRNRPIAPATITWRWHQVRKRAGLTGPDGQVWLHDCRRTWGSNMVPQLPLPEILSMAGWASPPTFIKHYHRMSPARLREIKNCLDSLARGARKPPRRPPQDEAAPLKIYKRY